MAGQAPGMTPAQQKASDPAASVWVGASAGTGKTKVLTDRVLRLLLGGTAPERILCLTFTRAAAAEMALRITRELARWTVADEDALADALAALTGDRPRRATLDRARRLFAAVLDVPDGLKIQTIHAFCQSLLRRFPLEAGVAPNFEIADERMSGALLGAARARLLSAARPEADEALASSLATMTAVIGEESFGALLADVSRERDRFTALIARHGGIGGAIGALKVPARRRRGRHGGRAARRGMRRPRIRCGEPGARRPRARRRHRDGQAAGGDDRGLARRRPRRPDGSLRQPIAAPSSA